MGINSGNIKRTFYVLKAIGTNLGSEGGRDATGEYVWKYSRTGCNYTTLRHRAAEFQTAGEAFEAIVARNAYFAKNGCVPVNRLAVVRVDEVETPSIAAGVKFSTNLKLTEGSDEYLVVSAQGCNPSVNDVFLHDYNVLAGKSHGWMSGLDNAARFQSVNAVLKAAYNSFGHFYSDRVAILRVIPQTIPATSTFTETVLP